jgi:hypothetical protein
MRLFLRGVNLGVFAFACCTLVILHLFWMAERVSMEVMGLWSGVAIVTLLGTIMSEHYLTRQPRGFDVEMRR